MSAERRSDERNLEVMAAAVSSGGSGEKTNVIFSLCLPSGTRQAKLGKIIWPQIMDRGQADSNLEWVEATIEQKR